MLKNVSHFVESQEGSEILYDTSFGYIFEYLCNCNEHLLPEGQKTIKYLLELGKIMADNGSQTDSMPESNSTIPAVYTYLGQFIDHDITARTDREVGFSKIENEKTIVPQDPHDVVKNLRNGRRPQLDLDSVFGEGPSFNSKYQAQADHLFNNTSLNMFIEDKNGDDSIVDLRRDFMPIPPSFNKKTGKITPGSKKSVARIADERNDENLMVSQLHAAFIKLFNKINTVLEPDFSNQEAYTRARQLCRWAYQYTVVNDYLNQVCDTAVVSDVQKNGPFFYDGSIPFMPLEFSVAAFRFGHSMIRPFYQINEGTQKSIMELLGTSMGGLLDSETGKLRPENVISWSNFANFEGNTPTNLARKIDPFIAKGLFDLSSVGTAPPPNVLASLAQRNLLRGYLLSIPIGQSVAEAMRITPLNHDELVLGLDEDQKCVLYESGFIARTPLWYYILQEAKVQHDGNCLGYVGSKLVAETLIGLVKNDKNSYMNHGFDAAVTENGIILPGQDEPVKTIADILAYAEVPIGMSVDEPSEA